MPCDKSDETGEGALAGIVADCVAKGGPDKRRQLLDVPDTVCPHSVSFEIEGVDSERKRKDVPCEFIGHELHTKQKEDPKTIWYYRPCYIAYREKP